MIENIKSILTMYLIFLFKREIPTVFKRKSHQSLTTLFTIWNESTLPFKLLFYPLYCHVDRRTVNPTDCTRTPLYFILGYSPEECKWGKAGSLGRGESGRLFISLRKMQLFFPCTIMYLWLLIISLVFIQAVHCPVFDLSRVEKVTYLSRDRSECWALADKAKKEL